MTGAGMNSQHVWLPATSKPVKIPALVGEGRDPKTPPLSGKLLAVHGSSRKEESVTLLWGNVNAGRWLFPWSMATPPCVCGQL